MALVIAASKTNATDGARSLMEVSQFCCAREYVASVLCDDALLVGSQHLDDDTAGHW